MSKKKRKKKSSEEQEQLRPMHVRCRPQSLDMIVGQEPVVKALRNLLSGRSRTHSFLFTGPSGVGKTTLARIIGNEHKVTSHNILEIDAATNSGVDAMRDVKRSVETPGFGDSTKLVIVDECHSLSKQAWQSWLKIVEEPPKHLYIVFCTTEAGKVPRTIKTRCASFDLKPVSIKELVRLIDETLFAEGVKTKLKTDAVRAIAVKADGSPRQALVYLQAAMHCKTRADVLEVIDQLDEESDEAFAIVRAIVNRDSFMKIKDMIAKIEDTNCEGIRIITMNYAAKALMGTKSKDKAAGLLEVMDEFSEPFNPNEKKAPLLLAVGRLLL